ncbi:MAG: DegT/DnrJ/EryC1/StrS family aminotransferase [Vicinamibacterales bacterium]
MRTVLLPRRRDDERDPQPRQGPAKVKPIHLFVPAFRVDECLAEIRECLERGWTGLGYKTVEFERQWIAHTRLPHAHFLNSATAGLHLAVRLLKERHGWGDGDEIISSPLTFVSSNHAILYERLRPVFADVDEYLCLDPASITERITPRTRAVIFVGLGGNTGRLDEVVELCRDRGLALILDAAHMTGTRLRGRHVGGEGEVSVFSFHAVKNLPTADGGMICFREGAADAAVRKWTWLGIDKDTYSRTQSDSAYKWHYQVEHVGFKYHGNSIMAGLGLVALRYLEQDNAHRRQLASWYDDALVDVPGVERVRVAPDCESARHLYQVLVDRRDDVMVALNTAEIYPGVHYRDNGLYTMYADQPPCPRARRASDRVISLPMHLGLDWFDVERVCDTLRRIVS